MVQTGKNGKGQVQKQQPDPLALLEASMYRASTEFGLRAFFAMKAQAEQHLKNKVHPSNLQIEIHPHEPTVVVSLKKPKSNIQIAQIVPELGDLKRGG